MDRETWKQQCKICVIRDPRIPFLTCPKGNRDPRIKLYEKCGPAVAYPFCPALPTAFTQPGDHLLADPSIPMETLKVKVNSTTCPPFPPSLLKNGVLLLCRLLLLLRPRFGGLRVRAAHISLARSYLTGTPELGKKTYFLTWNGITKVATTFFRVAISTGGEFNLFCLAGSPQPISTGRSCQSIAFQSPSSSRKDCFSAPARLTNFILFFWVDPL